MNTIKPPSLAAVAFVLRQMPFARDWMIDAIHRRTLDQLPRGQGNKANRRARRLETVKAHFAMLGL